MKITTEFEEGDTVYYINDKEQLGYIVVGFYVAGDKVKYHISHCGEMAYAFGFELSSEKTIQL